MEDKIECLLDMIPQQSHFYYYFRGCWANGKEGTITDSSGHGVFRFFPFVPDESGDLTGKIDHKDYVTNPIVATGIIGYWLHFRKNKDRLASYTTWTKEDERKNTLKIFSDYTEDKLKQYIEREEDTPSSWRRDLEKEFYTEFVIRNEEPLNEQTEALMEYITPADREVVKEVIAEYMLFLEEKKKAYKTGQGKKKRHNSKRRPKSKNAKNRNVFTKETFSCKGLNKDQYKEQRTGLFCYLLFKDFVAAKENERVIEKEKIEKLFTGIPLKKGETIVWKGAKKELVYFFRQLKSHLEYSSTVSFWDIVASHFVIKTEGKKMIQGKPKVRQVAISGDSLQNTSEKPVDEMCKKLEECTKMLTMPIAELLQTIPRNARHDEQEERDRAIAEKDLMRELKGYKKDGH